MKDSDKIKISIEFFEEMIRKQFNEINELQQRIDKARKYLKEREEDNMCCSVCSVMSDRLLEILGGKE